MKKLLIAVLLTASALALRAATYTQDGLVYSTDTAGNKGLPAAGVRVSGGSTPGTKTNLVVDGEIFTGTNGVAGGVVHYDQDGDHTAGIGAPNVVTTDAYYQLPAAPFNGPVALSYPGSSTNAQWVASSYTFATLTDGATITLTCDATKIEQNASVTLGGNRTLAISGVQNGMRGVLIVKQDATGSRTLTLPGSSKVYPGGGSTVTLSTAGNAADVLAWYYDGANVRWTYATEAGNSHTHSAADITSGTLAKARGGSGQDNSSITFPASGVLVTEAGTQTLQNKTLTTPTVGDLSNAQHTHQNAAGGGSLSAAAIGSGTLSIARGGTGQGTVAAAFDALSPNTTRGDITVRGASGNQRLALGRVGYVLVPWPNPDNTIDLVWKKAPQPFQFAGAGAGEWSTITMNSGSPSTGGTSDGSDSGFFTCSTGTLTNGGSGYRLASTAIRFGTDEKAVHWRIKTPAALSSNTDGYELFTGFGDNVSSDAAPVDGAYCYYLHSVSGGIWIGRTANNSVVTTATGGGSVTVTADAWWDFLVKGTATALEFYVSSDNAATWTYIGTSSSNIPSSAGRETGIEAYIRKVGPSPGGTTARIISLGHCLIYSE